MYYIALLLTIAKKRVCAPVAHKIYFMLLLQLKISYYTEGKYFDKISPKSKVKREQNGILCMFNIVFYIILDSTMKFKIFM